MPAESPADRLNKFLSTHARLVESLLAKTEAARWSLTGTRFAEALLRSAEHRFRGASPTAAEVAAYLESLHVEDLALACACSDGKEKAWDDFMRRYRDDLYAAAHAITGCRDRTPAGGGDARARELADSLYAELYGLAQHAAQRRSLFDYFHGRSKLSTWLRAVLAHRHVDALRAAQRTQSLDEKEETYVAETLRAHGSPVLPDPNRAHYLNMLHAALLQALAALPARDRLRLACYYVQELTLAEVGRILGEHEATASRHLERTRRALRKEVERALRAEKRLSEAQIHLSFEYAMEEWPFDMSRALSVPDGTDNRGQPAVTKLREQGPKSKES